MIYWEVLPIVCIGVGAIAYMIGWIDGRNGTTLFMKDKPDDH